MHGPVFSAFVLKKQVTGLPLWFNRPSKVKATHPGFFVHASQQACTEETFTPPWEPLPSIIPSVTLLQALLEAAATATAARRVAARAAAARDEAPIEDEAAVGTCY